MDRTCGFDWRYRLEASHHLQVINIVVLGRNERFTDEELDWPSSQWRATSWYPEIQVKTVLAFDKRYRRCGGDVVKLDLAVFVRWLRAHGPKRSIITRFMAMVEGESCR